MDRVHLTYFKKGFVSQFERTYEPSAPSLQPFFLKFYFKTRPLKELLEVLGGKTGGLVILRELLRIYAVSAVVNYTFKIWLVPSCFCTRTIHLTLIKVPLRRETLFPQPHYFILCFIILHVCHHNSHSLAAYVTCLVSPTAFMPLQWHWEAISSISMGTISIFFEIFIYWLHIVQQCVSFRLKNQRYLLFY